MNTTSVCYPHPSQYHGGTVFFPAILALTWISSGEFFFLNTVFLSSSLKNLCLTPLLTSGHHQQCCLLLPASKTFCIYQHYCEWTQAFQPLCWTALLPTVILMVSIPPPETVCACLPPSLPAAYAFGRNKDVWHPQVHFAEIFSHSKILKSTWSSCLTKNIILSST